MSLHVTQSARFLLPFIAIKSHWCTLGFTTLPLLSSFILLRLRFCPFYSRGYFWVIKKTGFSKDYFVEGKRNRLVAIEWRLMQRGSSFIQRKKDCTRDSKSNMRNLNKRWVEEWTDWLVLDFHQDRVDIVRKKNVKNSVRMTFIFRFCLFFFRLFLKLTT